MKKTFLAILFFLSLPLYIFPKKAIVVGASSGIGAALVKKLSSEGYEVGLIARRIEKMEAVTEQCTSKTFIKKVDITQDGSAEKLKQLIMDMKGVDLIVINSGVGKEDFDLDLSLQEQMIEVNVNGFSRIVHAVLEYFKSKKNGHLVGITSALGLRGMPGGAVYCGTKAYQQKYLEGLSATLDVAGFEDIVITDIRPGYVDTDMVENKERAFWMISPDEAAEDIFTAIEKKKEVAYVSKRWWLVALGMRIAPRFVFKWFL